MYSKNKIAKTSLIRNTSIEGERIEQKIERIMTQGEPITDGAPIVYTERKDGVRPEFDIRTDRFDIAIDAMDAVARSGVAKREAGILERDEIAKAKKAAEKAAKEGSGAPSTEGTKE